MRTRLHSEDGASLVEVLITMVLLGVVSMISSKTIISAQRSERAAEEVRADMVASRLAVDRIRKELRAASGVIAGSNATTLTFWVEADGDDAVDPSESITYALVTTGAETSLQRSTAAVPTPRLIADGLSSASLFTYDFVPPASRLVRIRLETMTRAGGPTPIVTTQQVRLRNVL